MSEEHRGTCSPGKRKWFVGLACVLVWVTLGLWALNWWCRSDFNTLTVAVRAGDVRQVQKLLDAGISPNGPRDPSRPHEPLYNMGPLQEAVHAGDSEIVAMLLRYGADVEAAGSGGPPPLEQAAWLGRSDLVRILLDAGASVNARDRSGGSALSRAAFSGHTEVARILLAAGAEVDRRGEQGATALHSAALGKNLDVVSLLIAKGANAGATDDGGNTPLHKAAAFPTKTSVPIVELLLSAGARRDQKNKAGQMPWQLADGPGDKELMALLRPDRESAASRPASRSSTQPCTTAPGP